jgi:hypothetical protein
MSEVGFFLEQTPLYWWGTNLSRSKEIRHNAMGLQISSKRVHHRFKSLASSPPEWVIEPRMGE